jgi:serine/threonine-protein kinase
LEQAEKDLRLVGQLEGIRLKAATWADGGFDYATADRDYASAFRESDLIREGEEIETVATQLRGSSIRDQVIAALDDWARVTANASRRAWLLAVLRRADPDPWRDRYRDPAVWKDRAALERLAAEAKVDELSPHLITALANIMKRNGANRVPLLTKAQRICPSDFWLNFQLGFTLAEEKSASEGIGYLRAALVVRPKSSPVHNNLGVALTSIGQLDEAIAELRQAIELNPKVVEPHINLGRALHEKKQLDAAIEEYRIAIALDPKAALPHSNLGAALADKQQWDMAIQECGIAIALDPKAASPHNNLGLALATKGQLDAAIQEYRRAIELDPKDARFHNNLGTALSDKKQQDEAIHEYLRAIQLDPKFAAPHRNLGQEFLNKHQLDAAIEEYHKAIALDSKYALAHAKLGVALAFKKQLDAAIEEYRRAIDLDPKLAQVYFGLCSALRQKGLLVESLREIRTGHRLGSEQPNWPNDSARMVREAENLVKLDRKLTAVMQGKERPDNDGERLALAQFCQLPFKQLNAASTRFFTEAFAHDVKLADDMQQQYRYNAACVAALAGCGQGKDVDKLDEKERARLRQQAVTWLNADLKHWTKQAQSVKLSDRALVQQTLQHWQEDSDLAALRDSVALGKLPADERAACHKLWDDVADLLKKVQGNAK